MKKGYWNHPEKFNHIEEQDTLVQLQWLESEIKSSTATWNLVIGHHPIYSSGKHGGTPELIRNFVPLFETGKVQAYFSGHEHDLQHQKPDGKIHYFISGAGAKSRPTGKHDYTLFSSSNLGFAYVTLTSMELKLSFINNTGKVIYETIIQKP